MTREVWPFKARNPATERLAWATDLFRAKGGEQRIAMRDAPRRTLNYNHVLSDSEYSSARALMRRSQAADGFWVPDWTQSVSVGALSAGSAVAISEDLSLFEFGADALVYSSIDQHERVALTVDSSGTSIDILSGSYSSARLVPVWPGNAIGGISADRIGAKLNRAGVEMQLTDGVNTPASAFSQYRSLDVLPHCPIIGAGSLSESMEWPSTTFDNVQAPAEFLRSRTIPDYAFTMRWHYFAQSDIHALRQWLRTLRGRQKAFWTSSFSQDLEPAQDAASTILTVYALPGFSGIGHVDPFDLEIKSTAGALSYRRVSSATAGTPVGGRPTLDLTLDSSLTIPAIDVDRISFLRCSRLNADRIEFSHRGKAGCVVQVPCIEIPEP